MILDHLNYADKYANIHPVFGHCFEYLKDFNESNAPEGKTQLNHYAFAFVQRYQSAPLETRVWEAHRKYIDIQYILSGSERIGYGAIHSLTETTPYNDTKDVAFFAAPQPATSLLLSAGFFGIFYPEDVHAPGIRTDKNPESIVKVIIKVEALR